MVTITTTNTATTMITAPHKHELSASNLTKIKQTGNSPQPVDYSDSSNLLLFESTDTKY